MSMAENETKTPTGPINSNILDRIMGSKTQSSLNDFSVLDLVQELLTQLKDRDREILSSRFGLAGTEIETLETIGKKYNLTRERVRQIEKDSLNGLKKKSLPALEKALQLIFDTILEHGSIISEDFLIQTLGLSKDDSHDRQSIRLLLSLGDQFENLKESPKYYDSWYIAGFEITKLDAVIAEFSKILENYGRVMSQDSLYEQFKRTSFFQQHQVELSERTLKNYLNIAKTIQINPFQEIGLKNWNEIKPRDVGDKAYLVLKHHAKPEHYSVITKLINDHKFDDRTAYQETVHNELIKDARFVLIGRGIYALSEWGYKKGVVADVIKEVLKAAGRALSRDEIIAEVMKRRQVKRNTILVGLSNRKNFARVGKDKYTMVQAPTEINT